MTVNALISKLFDLKNAGHGDLQCVDDMGYDIDLPLLEKRYDRKTDEEVLKITITGV